MCAIALCVEPQSNIEITEPFPYGISPYNIQSNISLHALKNLFGHCLYTRIFIVLLDILNCLLNVVCTSDLQLLPANFVKSKLSSSSQLGTCLQFGDIAPVLPTETFSLPTIFAIFISGDFAKSLAPGFCCKITNSSFWQLCFTDVRNLERFKNSFY